LIDFALFRIAGCTEYISAILKPETAGPIRHCINASGEKFSFMVFKMEKEQLKIAVRLTYIANIEKMP
jgi:hypothetical protein